MTRYPSVTTLEVGNHIVTTTIEVPLSPNTGQQPPYRILTENLYRQRLTITSPNTANDCVYLLFGETALAAQNGARFFTKQVAPITFDYTGELWLYVPMTNPFGTPPDNTFAIVHAIETVSTNQ